MPGSMTEEQIVPADIEVGVVGIGLMGSSIIVSLLVSGHQVKAIAPIPEDFEQAEARIAGLLDICAQADLLKYDIAYYTSRLEISMDYSTLANCHLVLECVIEDIDIKTTVYHAITDVVGHDAIIASNTSAIPISTLQQLVAIPGRFLGVHYAEPAFATRFMEITCGADTDEAKANWVFRLAHHWGKEPTLLRKDIKGFITNRLMYAVYREIFHLMDEGRASMDDADKVFRYDVGSWITLMGIFRRMDFTGVGDQIEIFKKTFPGLSNTDEVPEVMQKIVEENGRGIQNLQGLYAYSPEEAKKWEETFSQFNTEIFNLAAQYPYGEAPVNACAVNKVSSR
ncbi:3-hydroxyacyl-CoA dehydrogenase family protein [Mucilaginibacter mali]|nr:3-hydroxyacyl-CoA dehydrogenase NAD-binding domain-containing protein [Mucilaginibacter mali]